MEKEHGGIATREYFITDEVGWYSEKKLWKDMRTFGMVHKTIKTERGITEEYRYYIGSIEPDVELFERVARGHWEVEVELHWHMDFTFRDDQNTSMAKTGAKNLQKQEELFTFQWVYCRIKRSMDRKRRRENGWVL